MQKITFKDKTKKFISALLIISILAPTFLFSGPKKAEAIPVAEIPGAIIHWITQIFTVSTNTSTLINTSLSVKQWSEVLIRQALMAVARRALQKITESTVNWINSGFHGSPLFLENPESFFKDIAKSEIKNMVDDFGFDSLKYPFGRSFALNIINSYKSQFATNAEYSLSRVINDPVLLNNYRNNFNYGGWNGFLINTQYQQNNYLGFQMQATDVLAAKLQGTVQNKAEEVKKTLDLGQGFLSPQTCPSNPEYNNGINEFQRPSFDEAAYRQAHPYTPPSCDMVTTSCAQQLRHYDLVWTAARDIEKNEVWGPKNTCPDGLENTTPGSVVANQIMTSLTSGQKQTELAAAMGNSLSVIFDALLNKFIGDGLNSLSSKSNSSNTPDTWSYGGQTLSSPATGTNSTFNWNSVINVTEFKKTVQDAINNTNLEIRLMDNPPCNSTDPSCNINNPSNPGNVDPNSPNFYIPGIIQLMEPITKEAQTLDQCMPGPNKNWEDRLLREGNQASGNFTDLYSNDVEKARASSAAVKELNFAVDSFVNWITKQMKNSLPGATTYIDAIKKINGFHQQLKELTDAKQIKSETLDRLNTIYDTLATSTFSTQPISGSNEEKQLIELAKQYDTISFSVSSSDSISNTRNELDTLNDQKRKLEDFNIKCVNQRATAGWDAVDATGKGTSTQGGIKEIEKFCSIPIISGYSHGDANTSSSSGFTFRNPQNNLGNPGYTDLPMVNAKNVYEDININIDCNTVFKANPNDYSYTGNPSF